MKTAYWSPNLTFFEIMQEDFKPVLRELLATHPGLEFLQGTPEFQERYGESICFQQMWTECR